MSFTPPWLALSEACDAADLHGAVYAAREEPGVLADLARAFSPRIEICGPAEVTLDLSGLKRLFGDARTIAQELRRTAADRGLRVRVAVAGTRTAARLLVRHKAGITVVDPGAEAAALAGLPLSLLRDVRIVRDVRNIQNAPNAPNDLNDPNVPNGSNDPNDLSNDLRRWGLRTLGELAALPPDEVMARLGLPGIAWQRMARGEDARPLVPAAPEERFEQSIDLEWPIEGLEPLSFVLGRLMEPLAAHLERRGRGAAVLHVRLRLVTKALFERTLELPVPMREAKTLRTLALLDLESHPPPAAIDAVTVAVDPTAARVVQYSLLTRPLPTPEQLSTLLARLHALVGESRCGAPGTLDSWRPGAFEMRRFAPDGLADTPEPGVPAPDADAVATALRRFRHPIPARVEVEDGRPARVVLDRRGLRGGRVAACAGPWRTSGDWWRTGWDQDEWDVALEDGVTYRLLRERGSRHWFVGGVVD